MKPKQVYLAIWYDRHTDDEYAAFHSLDEAIAWCNDNARLQYKNYEFTKDEEILDDEWVYRLDSHDDGPKFSVRVIELF
jgi:hypothetical protein